MENDDALESETIPNHLGCFAYVVVDKANCLYEPNSTSAIRVIPPYGTKIEVVRDEGVWVLIRFCGKEAWSLRSNLAANLTNRMPAVTVGVAPASNYYFRSTYKPREPHNVEYGPRGGRFVRTSSGFKRYL